MLSFGNETINTFALIDNGSAITAIQTSLAKRLRATGVHTPLLLSFADKTTRVIRDSITVKLHITGIGKNCKKEALTARTMNLDLPTQTITRDELQSFGVTNPLLLGFECATPQLLIGLDHTCITAPTSTHTSNNLLVCESAIGWTVEGFFGRREEVPVSIARLNHLHCINFKELHRVVGDFIENENLGINPERAVLESHEKTLARKQLREGTRRLNNRYETRLLWRNEKRPGPCNRAYATSRLRSFERRMERAPHLRTRANEIIRGYRDKGYIEPVTGPTGGWYLPLFAVESRTKIRLVWDAAATTNGTSLNNMLLKGPDLNEPLWNILHRFREFKVAICADISEMFHRVQVAKEDRQYQRFLWRDDPRDEIQEYEMTVMTFGAASSPTIAQYVKNTNAERFAERLPQAAVAVQKNHYVDDWLQSCSSEEDAATLAKQVQEIQLAAGFHMHKWTSNRPKLLATLGIHNATTEKTLQDNTKALGIRWNTPTDSFLFDLQHVLPERLQTPTKREMLRTVMSLFDPQGLVAHIAIVGRLIMRETWKADSEWDEQIPETVMPKWNEWVGTLRELPQVRFPRWSGITERHRELHVFVDSSERAMCAAAYIKGGNGSQTITSLAATKCKLTPTTQKSIPRLELQAAVLGVRLAEMIQEASSVPMTKITFWTDAQDVLWWINSAKRRYKQYVALRVAEILSFSEANHWRWVPGELNPADIATKPSDFTNRSNLWMNGPPFLRQDESHWPPMPILEARQTEEIVKVLHLSLPAEQFQRAVADPNRVGTWNKLVRATALARRIPMKRPWKGLITVDEKKEAELELYREAQRQFATERAALEKQNYHQIGSKSELGGLELFIDDDKLIRFRSRNLNAAALPFDAKYPIVLPREHLITRRLLENYHYLFHHGNTQTVLNEFRQKFLVKRVRSLVNRIVRHCQHCAVKRAKPVYPQMGNHPIDRLAFKQKAFHCTGVDYFGPMMTTVGRRRQKRWGVLFTCLTTRAIHLEVAYDLTGESCVRCIENFTNRRGQIKIMRSDNATNFVWAAKELKDITWKFNAPAAPHQGGAWERLVASVKKALSQMEMPERIADDQLQNFLIKAEALINARPLTEIPIHPHQPALTPNHFIFGSSNGQLGDLDDAAEWQEGTQRIYQDLLVQRHEHQEALHHFWERWQKEYLPLIAARTKWTRKTEPLQKGDLVFICDPTGWSRGVVEEALMDPETEQVREVIVRCVNRNYRRPATKVAKIKIINQETEQRAPEENNE